MNLYFGGTMKKLTVMILTLFIAFNSYAQSRGMKEVAETNLGNKVNIGKQYALFIAIDACYSGSSGGTRNISGIDSTRLLKDIMDPSTVVFISSMGIEKSHENEREKHGTFTWAILQGLKGAADYNKNGQITMKMLDMYVSGKVP
jgi:hypothetical protein